MCGTANPCITLCAVLVGGIDGLENKLPLVAGDCQREVANLSAEERRGLRVTTKPHISIDESLKEFQSDGALVRGLGTPLVSAYVSIMEEWYEVLRKWRPRNGRTGSLVITEVITEDCTKIAYGGLCLIEKRSKWRVKAVEISESLGDQNETCVLEAPQTSRCNWF